MDYKSLNYSKLGKILGYSDVQVRKIILNRSIPRVDFIQSLIRIEPKLNSHWLLTGEGSMLLEDEAQPLRVEEPRAKYGKDVEQQLEAMEKRLTEIAARLEEKEKTWQEFGESFHRMFIKVYDLEQWQDKVDERLGIEQNRSAG